MVFDVSFDWITAGTGADEVLGGKKKPAVCLVSLYGNCGGGSPHLIDFNLRKCCVWQTERLTHVTLRRTASTNYLQLTQTILSPGNNCQETSNLIQPYQYHLFSTIRFVAGREKKSWLHVNDSIVKVTNLLQSRTTLYTTSRERWDQSMDVQKLQVDKFTVSTRPEGRDVLELCYRYSVIAVEQDWHECHWQCWLWLAQPWALLSFLSVVSF